MALSLVGMISMCSSFSSKLWKATPDEDGVGEAVGGFEGGSDEPRANDDEGKGRNKNRTQRRSTKSYSAQDFSGGER